MANTVQSIERAFGLLEAMADHDAGLGVSELAASSGLPLPTIHRLLRTLVTLGYVRQEPSRRYVLGPRLVRLGESSAATLHIWARPHLSALADSLEESANLAMLDGDQIVYVAQVQSRQSMRMFTEVGRRVFPHCTAVGKTLLASLPRDQVRRLLDRTGMRRLTEATITDPDVFMAQLDWVAEHGYAIDDGEQETGVSCVAVAVRDAPSKLAISVSGPAARMDDDLVAKAVPLLVEAGAALATDLA